MKKQLLSGWILPNSEVIEFICRSAPSSSIAEYLPSHRVPTFAPPR
ncbi:MAG: hypothetical protein ACI4QD_05980 [Kiritimatiellia bacterium]